MRRNLHLQFAAVNLILEDGTFCQHCINTSLEGEYNKCNLEIDICSLCTLTSQK